MTAKPPRLVYIDNLRVLLICLVILHHLALTYGAAGNWYYKTPQTSHLAMLVLTIFVIQNREQGHLRREGRYLDKCGKKSPI